MTAFLHWGAGVVVAQRGLIPLLSFASSLKRAMVPTLSHTTAVPGGRRELSVVGMSVFGGAWGTAALGFVLAAAAFLLRWTWWRPALVTIHCCSPLSITAPLRPASASIWRFPHG